MHPTAVIDHLAMAERHVTDCHLHVARQRQIVESLARKGQKTPLLFTYSAAREFVARMDGRTVC